MIRSITAFVLIGLMSLAAVISTFAASGNFNQPASNICEDTTIFEEFGSDSVANLKSDNSGSSTYIDGQGNMAYLFEDFERYAGNQIIIDGFENPGDWHANGGNVLKSSTEFYSGSGGLAYALVGEGNFGNLTLVRDSGVTQNLDMLSDLGYVTMWIKVPDPSGVDSVAIAIEDEFGDRRTFAPLVNVHTLDPNTFKDDPQYPDLIYPEGDPQRERWTDFMLGPGWNYLLWRTDAYSDDGTVNLSAVERVYVMVEVNENLIEQEMIFDDLRAQSGLQKSSNPTQGAWYPPHGRPQYGVYDIDVSEDGSDHELRLLNVRNTQYPSNGDHARMISSAPVPVDFVLKIRFTLKQLGEQDEQITIPSLVPAWTPAEWRQLPVAEGQRNNTYFRVTYDFEPSWDPGHDWFGAYLSLQYSRFGLTSVWPLERNILQDQEPKAGSRTAITEFSPKRDVQYEMDLLVKGQFASATIYEVKSEDCLERKSGISYIYEHQRLGEEKRYPLAIESTGNMRTVVHEVELVSLKEDLSASKLRRIN